MNHFQSQFAVILLLASFICPSLLVADSKVLDLSKLPKEELFKFYAGHWQYATEDKTAYGTADVKLKVDDKVLQDTTYGYVNNIKFLGTAMFMYEASKELWHQRWIDSLGNVLKVEIKLEPYDDAKGLALVGELEHQGIKMKHIWYNITSDRFETDLLMSQDGKSYQLVRRMPYIRLAADKAPGH